MIFEPRDFCPSSGPSQLMQFLSTETPLHNEDTEVYHERLHSCIQILRVNQQWRHFGFVDNVQKTPSSGMPNGPRSDHF